MIHNIFYFPWKVPSLNELNEFRAIQGPAVQSIIMRISPSKKKKKNSGYRYNLYNETKQKWSEKVCKVVSQTGFKSVESCYFNYLVVEKTLKRDPSNICASSIKFIEDGLMKAGVIPNDGWNNVKGINPQWVLDRKSSNGVMLVMSESYIDYPQLVSVYKTETSEGHESFWQLKGREIQHV